MLSYKILENVRKDLLPSHHHHQLKPFECHYKKDRTKHLLRLRPERKRTTNKLIKQSLELTKVAIHVDYELAKKRRKLKQPRRPRRQSLKLKSRLSKT